VLAPDVRAGQAQFVSQEITEEQTRLDVGFVADAVHRYAHDHAASAGRPVVADFRERSTALGRAHPTRTGRPRF
jgi:hypothetical protein